MKCPKCQFEPKTKDNSVHAGICPRCGQILSKPEPEDPDLSTVDFDSEQPLPPKKSHYLDAQPVKLMINASEKDHTDHDSVPTYQTKLFLNFQISMWSLYGFGIILGFYFIVHLQEGISEYSGLTMRRSPLLVIPLLAGFQAFLWLIKFKNEKIRNFAGLFSLFISAAFFLT